MKHINKCFEADIDLGAIGEFTCEVYYQPKCDFNITKVLVQIGHTQVNVRDFLHDERIDEMKRIIKNALADQSDKYYEDWRELH